MTESIIDGVLNDVPRYRILCIGRSGVGKSSLINRVFGIKEAVSRIFFHFRLLQDGLSVTRKVPAHKPGEADTNKELIPDENQYLAPHDPKGSEPGHNTNFDHAAQFLKERRGKELLKDRLHAIWLCTETTRNFWLWPINWKVGSSQLVSCVTSTNPLAFYAVVPVVIVFTKYDKLVQSNELQAVKENHGMDKETLRRTSEGSANDAFQTCKYSVEQTMYSLKIPTPPFINISVRQPKDYGDTIEILVRITCQIVQECLKGDARVTLAIAQRASLPEKINTCIDKGQLYVDKSFIH